MTASDPVCVVAVLAFVADDVELGHEAGYETGRELCTEVELANLVANISSDGGQRGQGSPSPT